MIDSLAVAAYLAPLSGGSGCNYLRENTCHVYITFLSPFTILPTV